MCLTRWNSDINDNHLRCSLRTLTTRTSRMESKCHVVPFRVDILGFSSHLWIHWETRCLQFGNCKLPMCNIAGLAPAWELFRKLKLLSHASTPRFHIAYQKTDFILREEAGVTADLREGRPRPPKSLSWGCMQNLELIWRAAFYIKPIYSFEPWACHYFERQSPG